MGFGFNPLGIRDAQHALSNEGRAKTRNWVFLHRRRVFRLSSVHFHRFVLRELRRHRGHGDGVAVRAQAIELCFNQAWPLSASSALRSRLHCRADFERIGAIHGHARHAERLCFLGERVSRDVVGIFEADVRVGLVVVVFQDVNDGQLPHGREVQRFVESSLLGRTVAEETVNDLAGIFHLRG